MKKNYKLLSLTRQGLFALALTVFSGVAFSQLSYTFNATGAVQTFTLPPGNWRLECWGANGGSITTLGGQGIGGYAMGEYNTSAAVTTLNILVGGRGFPASGSGSAAGAGGWNGGGGGAAVGRSGAGGGGATDIRVGGLAASNRIICAGAGGGAAYYGTGLISSSVAPGGHGGDIVAQNGSRIASSGSITVGGGGQGANGATPGVATFILSNGLATGAGGGGFSGGSIGQQGTSGGAGGAQGASGSGSTGGTAGGGAGYAGGAGGVQSGNQGVAGGGGSSYIGGVTSGTTIMFGQPGYVPSPDATGQGVVVITELCYITVFSTTGSNTLSPAICPGDVLVLATNAVGNYSWSTGATTNSIVVAPTTNTVYTVSGTGSLVCQTTNTINVTVNSGPVLNITASNSVVCLGQNVVLTASGGNGYQWAGGPATAQYTIAPTTSGSYTVTGTHTNNVCVSDSVISVGVVIPNVTFPGNTQVCAGNNVTLTASGADDYLWSGISTGNNGVLVFQPVATVTMVLVATTQSLNINCPVSQTFVVQMKTLPTLTASAGMQATCIKQTNTLTAIGASTYTWAAGVGTGSVVTVTPSVSTIYTVSGTDNNGCIGTTIVHAMVNPCAGIEEMNFGNKLFEVYPNPGQGAFFIKSDETTDLILVNQMGQQLQTIKLSVENNYTQEITNLSPGIYFVTPVKSGTGNVRKVIVQ